MTWQVLPAAAAPTSVDVAGQTLEFGINGAPDLDDTVYFDELPFTYHNILDLDGGACLQATIEFVDGTGDLVVEEVDYGSTWNFEGYEPVLEAEAEPEIDLYVTTENGDNASATFEVDFLYDDDFDVETGSSTPIQLSNLCIHAKDIDDRQFAGFSNPTSYRLSDRSVLSISDVSGFVIASETAGESSSSDDEENWLQVEYGSTSSIRFRVGIDSGSDDGASFGVRFACAGWTSGGSGPSYDLDLRHYQGRSTDSALPNTR